MATDLAQRAHQTLEQNRVDAIRLAQSTGMRRTADLLRGAQRDLEKRLRRAELGAGKQSFTATQLRAALAQVNVVARQVAGGLRGELLETGADAAAAGAQHAVDYLRAADKAFRGVGTQPLALREASMLDAGVAGSRASLLRSISDDESDHPGRMGVLHRYGVETVGHFERLMRVGLVAKKSWAEVQDDLTEASPFLKGAPAHWAARIVRTEAMGAYGRSAQAAVEEADEQLDDAVKIWSETFDDRTAADSYACHGQVRRPSEAFDTWYGPVMNPPMRPNDRACLVPHRIAWPIPPYLQPRSDAEVATAWKRDGRKGAPPSRGVMSTVPREQFGAAPVKKARAGAGRRPAAPAESGD